MIRISEKAGRAFEKKFSKKAKILDPPTIVYPNVQTFPAKHQTIKRTNGVVIEKYSASTSGFTDKKKGSGTSPEP